MKYSELTRPAPTGMIDLGRGRTELARMLSPSEDAAVRRAVLEPEPPIMTSPKGEPMADLRGNVLRDEGGSVYINKRVRWMHRLHAAMVAVTIGLETREGHTWDRANLCDPAEGRSGIGDDARRTAFSTAEMARAVYCRAAAADILGDDEHDGLLTQAELREAFGQIEKIGFGDLVAGSAEGNSGSAPGEDRAGAAAGATSA